MSILGVQPICCCRHSSTFFVMLLGGIIGFYFNGLVWLGVCCFGDYIIDFVRLFYCRYYYVCWLALFLRLQ